MKVGVMRNEQLTFRQHFKYVFSISNRDFLQIQTHDALLHIFEELELLVGAGAEQILELLVI
jgi:hypothetical protein